jgi:hypothetical protein
MRVDLEPEQIAFDLIGIALSYHVAVKLLGERGARSRARNAYERAVHRWTY